MKLKESAKIEQTEVHLSENMRALGLTESGSFIVNGLSTQMDQSNRCPFQPFFNILCISYACVCHKTI